MRRRRQAVARGFGRPELEQVRVGRLVQVEVDIADVPEQTQARGSRIPNLLHQRGGGRLYPRFHPGQAGASRVRQDSQDDSGSREKSSEDEEVPHLHGQPVY